MCVSHVSGQWYALNKYLLAIKRKRTQGQKPLDLAVSGKVLVISGEKWLMFTKCSRTDTGLSLAFSDPLLACRYLLTWHQSTCVPSTCVPSDC